MKSPELLATHPLLSDRIRLSIMAALGASKISLDFNFLTESLGLTKGNLSSHLRKLEENGLIEVKKEFVERKPRTTYTCTKSGRTELEKYLKQMEHLIKTIYPKR